MQSSSSPNERYDEFLTANGFTHTHEAARVVDAVFAWQGPFSGEDVVGKFGSAVPRVTIYRTLTRMVDAGMLLPVIFNQRPAYVVASGDLTTDI
jgi:Fe2+ or Zn2+ uptake regulation protein